MAINHQARQSQNVKFLVLGSLCKGVFELHASTGMEGGTTKSALLTWLSVFILIETVCPKMWTKPGPKNAEVHLRLTYVVQKRCCLKLYFIIREIQDWTGRK